MIEQLGHRDPPKREAAYDALARLGVPALPAIKRATYHRLREVRWRAERLLCALIPTEAWNERTREALNTKHVTIEAQHLPLEQVVADFARQTGLQVELSPALHARVKDDPLRVSLSVKDYGAGLALDRMLGDAKLTASLVFNAVFIENGPGQQSEMLKRVLGEKAGPFAFKNTPLLEALEQIREKIPVGLAFDGAVFSREEWQARTVTLTLKKPMRLESVLGMLLDGYDLGYAYDERRLLITSKDRAKDAAYIDSFEARDLIKSLNERLGDAGRTALIDTIKTCVDRQGWSKSMQLRWQRGDEMVVRQRRSTLARIENYLRTLQRVEGLLNAQATGEDLEF